MRRFGILKDFNIRSVHQENVSHLIYPIFIFPGKKKKKRYTVNMKDMWSL